MCICNWIKALFRCKNQEKSIDAAKADAFVKTWSLEDFVKKFGPKMELGKFPEKNNRESFQRCRFTDTKGSRTYTSISFRIGEITPEQIKERKEKLRIGKLPNGHYVLYDNNWKDWKNVDLGTE